jgi:hypothetical protein
MAKYLLAYKGGAMGGTPEEQKKQMEAWMNWFGSLGDSVVDGGAPFGPSSTVGSDGAVKDGGSAALTGYSIISAGSVSEAATKAKDCPVLQTGGTIDVYEALPM